MMVYHVLTSQKRQCYTPFTSSNLQTVNLKGVYMHPDIRKTVVTTETVYTDGGKAAATPLVMIAAAAVVKNPWAGRGFVEDLAPEIREMAPVLGELLTGLIVKEAGGGERVVAYGKCAVTGLNGELEHASALIHTLPFGNHYRHSTIRAARPAPRSSSR